MAHKGLVALRRIIPNTTTRRLIVSDLCRARLSLRREILDALDIVSADDRCAILDFIDEI